MNPQVRGGDTGQSAVVHQFAPFLFGLGAGIVVYIVISLIIGQSRGLMYGSGIVGIGAVIFWDKRSRLRRFRKLVSQQTICDVVVDDKGLSMFADGSAQKHSWQEIESVALTSNSIKFLCGNGTINEFSVSAIGSSERMQAIWQFAQNIVRQKVQTPNAGSGLLL